MNSLALLKRTLLAMVGVFAFLGIARPAVAAPFYFYVITAPPNWGFGNPQALQSWSALTALGPGAPTAPEDYVSLGLQGYPGYWYAYDTFLGESNSFIGADVSIPTAAWTAPAAYYWVGGPAGGGELAFFNTFNPFTGLFYANALIVGDPPCTDTGCPDMSTFVSDLGGNTSFLTSPTLIPLDQLNTITPPGWNEDQSITPPNPLGPNYFDSGSQFVTPEGPTAIYLLLGIFVIGASVFFRRLSAIPLNRQ